MRVDNGQFDNANSSLSKEPRYVAAIDFDGGDPHYFTTHSDAMLPAGLTSDQYTHSVLRVNALASQTLKPNDGLATIGKMAFDLLDIDGAVTTLLRTKLEAGKGIRKTKVALYKGFKGFADFTTYQLVGTQIVDGKLDYRKSDATYRVNCLDPQHLLKTKIFTLTKTNITASVAANDGTINVGDTSSFEMFEHDSGYDDAPSATVGYLKIKKNNDEFEIVRYTSKTATSFGSLERGALGTKPLEFAYTVGDEADRQVEVEEYIYLEGPILKIAYAVLTGSLYGQAGKTLPSNWHLGIDTSYVSTSSFTGIGSDVWNTTDPTLGYQCRFQGIGSTDGEDGKKFFEKELMLLAGCFHRVLADGQIAVSRMAYAGADASTLGTLDSSCVTQAATLTHSLEDVANLYAITWNWEDLLGKYTRDTLVADGDSVSVHEVGNVKAYKFRGMYGNRMTVDRIYGRFDSLRAMYAGPPLELTLQAHGRVDMYDVGDTVRVSLNNVRDFTNGAQVTLDRAFVVFGKKLDAESGAVTYQLFGSSQNASALPPPSVTGLSSVLPDSFYSSGLNPANNIETMALAVDPVNGFEVVGGVGILHADITCTGVAGDINHTDSVFWYDGDLEIASDATVTVVNGAQFRARGFLENKGTITAKGGGLAGSTGYTERAYDYGSFTNTVRHGSPGSAGFIGSTQGGGSFVAARWSYAADAANGTYSTMPALSIEYDSGSLIGIPPDLRGTSGGAGNATRVYPFEPWVAGGAGGSSGAPVVIVARGMSTLAGHIDVSGDDGSLGSLSTYDASHSTYSGTGGGGEASVFLAVIDGGANGFTGYERITANRGNTTPQGNVQTAAVQEFGAAPWYSYYTGLGEEAHGAANACVTHVIGQQTPQQDVPQTTSDPVSIGLVEYTNLPITVSGDKSSIEINVDVPSDSNYDYSNIYYRKYNNGDPWALLGPASPETVHVVTSDGATWEYQARSVSTLGLESPTGPTATITTTSVYKIHPDKPVGFVSVRNGKNLRFSWEYDPTTKIYELRRGGTWESSVLLGRPAAPPYDLDSALPGTYLLKAVSADGVYSVDAASVIVDTAGDVNIIVTHDESTGGWNGTTSNTVATDDGVELSGTLTWADWDQPWDTYTESWLQESAINTSGTYITEVLDIAELITARVEIDPVIEQIAIGSNWESWDQPWSYYGDGWTWEGPLGIVSAEFEVRTSDDNVTWGDWRTYVTGDYNFRYVQFRITLNTGDDSYLARISQFIVKVDVPDRTSKFEDESIPVNGTTITFDPAFHITAPVVHVTIQDGSAGDSYEVTNKSTTSVDVEIFDSGGSSKAALVDITAEGY